jgi:Protein of unknown function (DUF3297)
MSDTPPDRLSVSPRSPYFGGKLLERGIGIRFKGKQRHDVEEYSVSEGWIRVQMGKSRDRFGQAMTIKLSGEVKAWFEDVGEDGGAGGVTDDAPAENDGPDEQG